jgi:hypothetical protein
MHLLLPGLDSSPEPSGAKWGQTRMALGSGIACTLLVLFNWFRELPARRGFPRKRHPLGLRRGIQQPATGAGRKNPARGIAARAEQAQWALAWCLKNPAVASVIVGCKTIAQLESNAAAGEMTA